MRSATAKKILVVDDDSKIRRALRAILGSQMWTVIEARDGYEAIEEIKADCPDLVLLDINMPGINGFETCRRIRSFSDVPIIAITVRADEPDKVTAWGAGVNGYIVKPFGTEELLARIRAMERRAPRPIEAPLNAHGLDVDFAQRRALVNGRPIHLTPKEFELLKYLIANHGKPVSHLNFVQHLWGSARPADREALRVLIRALRRKIEQDPKHPRYIHTENRIGYRFDPDYAK